jgi:glycosyltransferase involved in cell wall biosynthesis
LRVAQIIETLTMGGAENLAVNIANHLAVQGHESHLIIITGPDVLSAKVHPSVHLHYLEFERASLNNPFRFAVSLWKGNRLVSKVVTSQGISVVQTHLPGSNYWGLLLEMGHKCAALATIHNNEEFRYGESDNGLFAYLRKKAYQQILRRCHGMIAVSDEVRSSLVRELDASPEEAARISVVTNAVAVPEPLSGDRRTSLRAEFGIPEGIPFILAAGRFGEQKNFGDLVTAAEKLKDRGLDFRLVIAGEGEERLRLAGLVEERGLAALVSLPGNLTNLGLVMQAADIFVMSSLWEGLPLVLLEALAAGLPVAAYSIPGIDELLGGPDAGVTVSVGDVTALSGKLAELCGDEALRRNRGRSGRAMIEQEYSFTRLMGRLEELYAAAAGETADIREKDGIQT